MIKEYQECLMCLEGPAYRIDGLMPAPGTERRTELKWIGPLKDIHVCPVCDMLGE